MRVVGVVVVTTSLIASCVSMSAAEVARATDIVRDRAGAIQIARKACSAGAGMERSGAWHASLHNEVWHVWLRIRGAGFKCRTVYDTTVKAIDGEPAGCTVCVEGS